MRIVLLQIKRKISNILLLIVTYYWFLSQKPLEMKKPLILSVRLSLSLQPVQNLNIEFYMPSFCYSMFLEYGSTILDLVTSYITAFV